ncbi:MAG: Si-specific NAD(P)(+) transhydrogenase [bacterium]|nr:Si-specific NAD(P)(+) transhydrogenase [bacterium]
MSDYQLCVIGSGPGGQKAAIQAAKLGKKVCIVERMEQVGGVAIHTGTIPSKALRQAIIEATGGKDHLKVRADIKSGDLTIDVLMASCQRIIATEMEIVLTQLRRNGVDLVQGAGSFKDKNSIIVKSFHGEKVISADRFIVAVGTEPVRPDFIPFDDECILTSDDLLHLSRLPESLVVVGGGVVGTEFASMFSRLGVRVTMVVKTQRVLGFLDLQIGEALQYHMRNRGMTLRFGEQLKEVKKVEGEGKPHVQIKLKSGKCLQADAFLYCQGRQGVTDTLDLQNANLEADHRGRIKVDENYQTANPEIYAVGDVIGFPALASTSMNQGRLASCHMFKAPLHGMRKFFPFGIYSIPEISMVGDTEEELTELGVPYETGCAGYKEIARGQLIGDDVGLVKILFHPESREVLGVHIIGTGATELIHIGQAVMALGGKLDYFIDSAFNYPTLAEGYRVAALNGANKVR